MPDVATTAAALRAVVAEMGDNSSEFTGTAATRHRLEGAAVALEAITDVD